MTPCLIILQHLRNIQNTITDIKYFLGRKFAEPEIKEELSRYPVRSVETETGDIGFKVHL